MTRAILIEVLLFLLPFAAFALYLLARRQNPLRAEAWSDRTLWLVIAGFVLAAGALVATGVFAEREQGVFEPTRVENGRVVPGRFR